MPLGTQRCVAGTEASQSMPMTNSARLQAAMAWNVPMWFCTPHHFGAEATARPGSMTRSRGSDVRK